jgi:hypothetical protein
MSTLAVVEGILRQAEVPMSVREIVERAGEALPTKSKTPDTVVARDLSMDIKKKGETSIFIRTSPGRYTVREVHVKRMGSGTMPPPMTTSTNVTNVTPPGAIEVERSTPRGPGFSDNEAN